MSQPLVLATHNAGKIAELRHILAGLQVTLLSADDVGLPDVDETGASFGANALLKATAGVTASGLPCVADDSGLEVDALDGAPGIYSARFAAMNGVPSDRPGDADTVNLNLVLQQMADVPKSQRTARFVCAAALALCDGTHEIVEATLEGTMLHEPRGDGGFGYDPLFVPVGHTITTAEMSQPQKDAVSHRGQAFRALRPFIALRL